MLRRTPLGNVNCALSVDGNAFNLERIMKKLIASVMALTLGASAAMAGGPVVVEEEVEVVAEKSGSSVGILPIILVTVALCAALCGGSDDSEQ